MIVETGWIVEVINKIINHNNWIVLCPYCGKVAKYVTGREIYSSRGKWDDMWFWACLPCGAWVGCHRYSKKHGFRGDEPLGRLANARLRQRKRAAHDAFDPLWNKNARLKRVDAYKWLAGKLGIPVEECHIGMFDVEMCDKVIRAVKERK